MFNNSLKGIKDFIDFVRSPYSFFGGVVGWVIIFLLVVMSKTRGDNENLLSMDNFLKAIKYIPNITTIENIQMLVKMIFFGGIFLFSFLIVGMIFVKALTSIEVD